MKSLYERLLDNKFKVATYVTPKEFLSACAEYFEWAESTPLQETHLFAYQGCVTSEEVDKVRAFTKSGLASFLNIPVSRLKTYKDRGDEWADAIELVEQIMHEQKFTAAAAGLMNPGLIGRDLGLADKRELTGADGAPLMPVVQYELPSNGRDE